MEINLYPPSQAESETFPPVGKGKTSDETGSEGHSIRSSSGLPDIWDESIHMQAFAFESVHQNKHPECSN